ncbi:hypothetical protein B4U80_11752 [Leptotrombidium deliense]|uniref:F-box domain-containing protein n=1 Tax=Leptotrombidium deliense TaxID=299467 RepID=A0A443S2W5_9ACAR|nr:hypothetical protein B4U80_11752 [Leptotrombidium deliense]
MVRATPSDPFAQKLLTSLRKNINLFNGYRVISLTINGLPTNTKDDIKEMERQRRRNNFLRDTSELLEKEFERIKNYKNLSHFSILPEEITVKILDMLSVSELFSLRLVSKEMKQWAELTIRSHIHILRIDRDLQSTYRFYLWSNLYSNIKTLTISGTRIDLEVVLRICENKFPYLTSLSVSRCDLHKAEIFGDYFPIIKNLKLGYMENCGEKIAGLLSQFPQLITLKVRGSVYTSVAPFVSVGQCASNLRSFTCVCYAAQVINCKDISNTWVAEMPNLTSLHLNLYSTILLNFSDLQLMTITELELCCSSLEGCLTLPQNVSVTKLILNTETNSSEEIGAVLVNFTNLKSLELDFSLNHDIRFNATLLEALVSLNSLKYFSFCDTYYSKTKYYTLNDGEKSALVEALVALINVHKIEIYFCRRSAVDDDLITAIKNLTAKRPQQKIQLIITDNFYPKDCLIKLSQAMQYYSK